jgi:hypothetical protein
MTPERLAKIKAIAEDPNCHPRIRAVAQQKLEAHISFEEPAPPQHQAHRNAAEQHPGVKPTPEYIRFRYMDVGNWGRTKNGNPIHTTTIGGRTYKIVLFAFKRSIGFGWMRIDAETQNQIFCETRHSTIQEAHQDSWESLMRL